MTKFDISKPPTTVWRCDSIREPRPLPATISANGRWAVLTNGDRKAVGKTVCLTEREAYAVWVQRLVSVANNSYLSLKAPDIHVYAVDTLKSVRAAEKLINRVYSK